MASNTPNYDLIKPAATDFYHVEDQNANMDKLDAALKGLADGKAPATHATQHAAGGSDPVTPAAIGAAEAGHTHTPEDIGAAPASHTHDDRYFTQAENLSSATAALYGLGNGAVPNEVLAWIGKYNLYWWKKRPYISGYYEKHSAPVSSTGSGQPDIVSNNSRIIYYADTITINQTNGSITMKNEQSITLIYTDFKTTGNATILRGKYVRNASFAPSSILYIPTNSVPDYDYYGDDNYYGCFDPTYVVSSYYNDSRGEWTFFYSYNRDSYPDSGDQSDGYEYQHLGVPFDNVVTAPRIETGAYIGTGTYGSANRNSLTFNFIPKLVFVQGSYGGCVFVNPAAVADTTMQNANTSNAAENVSWSGETVSWYYKVSASGPAYQLNTSGEIYYYVAIG